MNAVFSYGDFDPSGFYYPAYPIGALETLRGVLNTLRYKPGWDFSLGAHAGSALHLRIRIDTLDSRDGSPTRAARQLPVPPMSFSTERWERWIFDQIMLVERHEACEHFSVDERRPFYPEHGPGVDPYKLARTAQ